MVRCWGLTLNNGANFGNKSFINYTLSFQHVSQASRPGVVDAAGDAADFGASFALFKNTNLAVVVNNIFNVMPKWNLVALNEAGKQVLNDPAQVKTNINAITFNGRYPNVTYDESHFSQLGTTFNASLNVRF